ncbi:MULTISPECIES: tripartite tricarboxylate transporter substrate-binding protein [unclassified Chelatococcus]|uniref:Bug family tripartite tricarboxylate transporter substrate binding protein n=1 Tax=unclassified Chelatococcus TaxID=2638111 RepID=UPI001BCD5BBD|nr:MULTISPECIES: tripartite tricarboxylate transporter substrate-binding protein [unclassified Chelatococcus]MBS7743745.1 tripartite tricarboxylate transporter substrate binding protein [Chelatococcus sp. HY11]MBX3547253.1 tripartite tricarboxylate transporter substrate binding protein [Chelatococcus sp.]
MALAQQYPGKPITIVANLAPGSTGDMIAREVGAVLSTRLAQPVLIENKAGAGGMLGAQDVVKAAPDGYRLLLTSSGLTAEQSLRSSDFDIREKLAPITDAVSISLGLMVNSKMPAKTVQEFIALAKERDGSLRFGSAGVGSAIHLAAESFLLAAGIKMVHVPYQGGTAVVTGLLQDEIQAIVFDPTAAAGMLQAGQLRMVALGGNSRSPNYPDTPSFSEGGLPGFDPGAWYGFFAPKGTPAEIIQTLQNNIAEALKDPAVFKKFSEKGFRIVGSSSDKFAVRINEDVEHWKRVIEDAKVSVK